MVDYLVYLFTNYSLPVTIFNNPQIQYFPFSIVLIIPPFLSISSGWAFIAELNISLFD